MGWLRPVAEQGVVHLSKDRLSARVHLVCDNYGTHKTPAITTWLATHPRFHMHHTPTYSSWLNQIERWFAYLTEDMLRRGDHRSVQALENDIRTWVKAWNDIPDRSSGPRPVKSSLTHSAD
jgi:transposase